MDNLDLSYTSDYKDYMMTTSDDEDYEDWEEVPYWHFFELWFAWTLTWHLNYNKLCIISYVTTFP